MTVDCSFLNGTSNVTNVLSPNADISGIGVLGGFLATAFLTLLLVIIQYLLDGIPDLRNNPIDNAILDAIWLGSNRHISESGRKVLQNAVLMFSDQQLVTGLALLITGFTQLNKGLSSYHWQILVYLVWFASLTHLTTITVLRAYLLENPVLRSWRAVGMGALGLMLCAALWATGHDTWFPQLITANGPLEPSNVAIPAKCYFNTKLTCQEPCPFAINRFDYRSIMLVSMCVLITGYISRFIKLFKTSSSYARLWLRKKPGYLVKGWMKSLYEKNKESPRIWLVLMHEFLLGPLLAFRVLYDIFESMLWELFWLCFGLAMGLRRLYLSRNVVLERPTDENDWSFGQFLPLLLLILPIFSVGESLFESSVRSRFFEDVYPVEDIQLRELESTEVSCERPDKKNRMDPFENEGQASTSQAEGSTRSSPPPEYEFEQAEISHVVRVQPIFIIPEDASAINYYSYPWYSSFSKAAIFTFAIGFSYSLWLWNRAFSFPGGSIFITIIYTFSIFIPMIVLFISSYCTLFAVLEHTKKGVLERTEQRFGKFWRDWVKFFIRWLHVPVLFVVFTALLLGVDPQSVQRWLWG